MRPRGQHHLFLFRHVELDDPVGRLGIERVIVRNDARAGSKLCAQLRQELLQQMRQRVERHDRGLAQVGFEEVALHEAGEVPDTRPFGRSPRQFDEASLASSACAKHGATGCCPVHKRLLLFSLLFISGLRDAT